ncbi:hypothetical protein GT022_20585, partial [Agaribacter marinus]
QVVVVPVGLPLASFPLVVVVVVVVVVQTPALQCLVVVVLVVVVVLLPSGLVTSVTLSSRFLLSDSGT